MRNITGVIVLIAAIALGLAAALLVARRLKTPARQMGKAAKATQPRPEDRAPKPPARLFDAIPKGRRAVSIRVDEVTGVSRKLQKGDIVDVIVTTPSPDDSAGRVARTLLQSIPVFDVAGDNPSSGKLYARTRDSWVVTLLTAPEQAKALAAAGAAGELHLLVRSPRDQEPTHTADLAYTRAVGLAALDSAATAQELDPRRLVRPGMRVFTLQARATDGIVGRLRAGDYVDVVITCPYSYFETSGDESVGAEGLVTGTRMASRTLLQNVEVVAVRPSAAGATSDSEALAARQKTVSLLVSLQDAEKLTVAMDATKNSAIRLLTRNPEDRAEVNTTGQLLIELLTQKRQYLSVDVIRGTQVTRRKFYRSGALPGGTNGDQ